MLHKFLIPLTLLLGATASVLGARPSSTAPGANALIVRQTGTKGGEFKTISAAVKSLGTTGKSAKTIFVYGGVYKEQVSRQRCLLSTEANPYVNLQVSISYPGPLTLVGQTSA